MTDQVPPITIQDLAAAVQIIDISAKRGAFEGQELSQVGAVRDRIASFIQQQTPEQPTEEVEESTEQQEETTE